MLKYSFVTESKGIQFKIIWRLFFFFLTKKSLQKCFDNVKKKVQIIHECYSRVSRFNISMHVLGEDVGQRDALAVHFFLPSGGWCGVVT